jgi:hypothetical protein
MTICHSCKDEITKQDEMDGNFREISTLPGKYMHIRCPGKETYWEERRNAQAREFAAQDDGGDEQYDASTWIVKRR